MKTTDNRLKCLNIKNPIKEITEAWASDLEYLDDKQMCELNKSISDDMKKFMNDFNEKEIISHVEAAKIKINT